MNAVQLLQAVVLQVRQLSITLHRQIIPRIMLEDLAQ